MISLAPSPPKMKRYEYAAQHVINNLLDTWHCRIVNISTNPRDEYDQVSHIRRKEDETGL